MSLRGTGVDSGCYYNKRLGGQASKADLLASTIFVINNNALLFYRDGSRCWDIPVLHSVAHVYGRKVKVDAMVVLFVEMEPNLNTSQGSEEAGARARYSERSFI